MQAQCLVPFPLFSFQGTMYPERTRKRIENEVFSDIVGVFNGEGPPVPIPNTEVKLTSADDTCLATSRENRSTPTQSPSERMGSDFFSPGSFVWLRMPRKPF